MYILQALVQAEKADHIPLVIHGLLDATLRRHRKTFGLTKEYLTGQHDLNIFDINVQPRFCNEKDVRPLLMNHKLKLSLLVENKAQVDSVILHCWHPGAQQRNCLGFLVKKPFRLTKFVSPRDFSWPISSKIPLYFSLSDWL